MKKLLFLLTFLSIASIIFAQVSKTVNLATAGTLSTSISLNDLNTITSLTLTGNIDARDFKTMRDEMPMLGVLDLSGVMIDAYNGSEGTLPKSIDYPVNTIPKYAFLNPNSREGKIRLNTIVIPSTVTSIGDLAFYGCTGLTNIVIPSSVTSIGESAFMDCSGIITVESGNPNYLGIDGVLYDKAQTKLIQCPISKKGSLTIPSSVISIEDYAFYNCSELTSIHIPSSVTLIGNNSFYRCYGLTNVTIPLSVTSIGERAFFNCSGLTSLAIPAVTSLAKQVFQGCSGLTTITIPSTVTSIGEDAFYNCSGLTTVTIPLSVTSIGKGAFYECSGLKSINLPPVTSIGKNVFYGCSGLTSIAIPSTVTSLGDGAFYGCSKLTTVAIPSSVTSIGDVAFFNCTKLTTVSIPSSVSSIGDNTFGGCSELTTVDIPSSVTSIGEGVFSGCTKLDNIAIPDSVTSIGNVAFYYCRGLTSISIPASVTSIGNSAFEGCNNLTSITSYRIIPLDLSPSSYVFSMIDKVNCTLYVPVGSKSSYQAADQWKDFINIVEKDLTVTSPVINDQSLSIYPNPTTGKIKIVFEEIPGKGTTLMVHDFTGKTILTQLIQNMEEQIDLEGNLPGVYLIRSNMKDFKVKKVILK